MKWYSFNGTFILNPAATQYTRLVFIIQSPKVKMIMGDLQIQLCDCGVAKHIWTKEKWKVWEISVACKADGETQWFLRWEMHWKAVPLPSYSRGSIIIHNTVCHCSLLAFVVVVVVFLLQPPPPLLFLLRTFLLSFTTNATHTHRRRESCFFCPRITFIINIIKWRFNDMNSEYNIISSASEW